MTRFTSSISNVRLAVTAAFIAGNAMIPSARADWTPTIELTEVMMEALGQEGMNLSEWVGYNEFSTIQFSTLVNVAERTFFYQTQSGQSYLGQAINVTCNGWYDQENSMYRWSTQVSHPVDSYSVDGFMAFSEGGSFAGPAASTGCIIDGVEGTLGPVTWSWAPNGDPISHANFTWKKKNGQLGGVAPVKDTYKGNGEMEWHFVNGVPAMAGVSYNGWSDPLAGGTGWVTMAIGSAVPAPGPLMLLAAAAIIARRRRGRQP